MTEVLKLLIGLVRYGNESEWFIEHDHTHEKFFVKIYNKDNKRIMCEHFYETHGSLITPLERIAAEIDVCNKVIKQVFDFGLSSYPGFQFGVQNWMLECFGEEVMRHVPERNHRFLEESLELVQSLDCTKEEALQLVEYVFDRPKGEAHKEVGGVMVTLAALCIAADVQMNECADTELMRIWKMIDAIRDKWLSKPTNSPLPGKYKDNGTANTN